MQLWPKFEHLLKSALKYEIRLTHLRRHQSDFQKYMLQVVYTIGAKGKDLQISFSK